LQVVPKRAGFLLPNDTDFNAFALRHAKKAADWIY
jgi:hypothetical protein